MRMSKEGGIPRPDADKHLLVSLPPYLTTGPSLTMYVYEGGYNLLALGVAAAIQSKKDDE